MSDNATSDGSALPRRRSASLTPAREEKTKSRFSGDGAVPSLDVRPAMSAQIIQRVMINFQISSRSLIRELPAGVELLPYRSAFYVTFVASHVRGVKKFGVPLSGFNMITLRTYVRATGSSQAVGTLILRRYVSSSIGAWILKRHLGVNAQVISIARKSEFKKDAPLPSVGYRWKMGDADNTLMVKTRSRIKTQTVNSKHGWMLGHLDEFSASGKTASLIKTTQPDCKRFDVAKATFKCSAKQMFGDAFRKPLAARPAAVYMFCGGTTEFLPPVAV